MTPDEVESVLLQDLEFMTSTLLDVASLAEPSDDDQTTLDVRLQVWIGDDRPHWDIHYGPSDYDQDHRGHWGASGVAADADRDTLRDVARDLIDQACESIAMDAE